MSTSFDNVPGDSTGGLARTLTYASLRLGKAVAALAAFARRASQVGDEVVLPNEKLWNTYRVINVETPDGRSASALCVIRSDCSTRPYLLEDPFSDADVLWGSAPQWGPCGRVEVVVGASADQRRFLTHLRAIEGGLLLVREDREIRNAALRAVQEADFRGLDIAS